MPKPRKGHPRTPGAGRKKGTPNKINTKLLTLLVRAGEHERTPLGQLLRVMWHYERRTTIAEDNLLRLSQESTPDPEEVLEASRHLDQMIEKLGQWAKETAPFMHAKLATTTLKSDTPMNHKIEVVFIDAEDGRPAGSERSITIDAEPVVAQPHALLGDSGQTG